MAIYQHWQCQHDASGITRWVINQSDSKVNLLNAEVLSELEHLLNDIKTDSHRGLIIESGKASGFSAGADIKGFMRIESHSAALEKLRYGQALFSRLEKLSCPTVAKIHGYCLGGGLELALACDWRVAEDNPDCRLGLPEIRLGIHPGYGGSIRLPQLVGDIPALSLMLTGRIINARQAQKLGLVDYAVAARHLDTAAETAAVKWPTRKSRYQHIVLEVPPVRAAMAFFLRKQTARRVRQAHYPAPYRLIDHWRRMPEETTACYDAEARSVAKLSITPTTRNLARAFLLREKLKAYGKERTVRFQHIHVVGAGVMGGDIAAWCARKGLRTTLQDCNHEQIAAAIARADKLFQHQLRVPQLITAASDRLIPDAHGNGAATADIIIEAVSENLELKQKIYAEIETKMKPTAILASNTSSLPLEQLAQNLKHPQRFVGLHFFNPVAKMQLIEVVQSESDNDDATAVAAAFAVRIGRLPLPVKSAPGFLVNRILLPYLLEAAMMVDAGIAPAAIDATATEFGMPMGPIQLADVVGLDVCHAVAEIIADVLNISIPDSLSQRVAAGQFGKKTGQGYYRWRQDKPVKPRHWRISRQTSVADVGDRLMMSLLNECVACLDEKIVTSADLIDAAMIFGAGFAPFRGGPMHYLKTAGSAQIKMTLQKLATRYGERFQPKSGFGRLRE